jgi:hypothetical protein
MHVKQMNKINNKGEEEEEDAETKEDIRESGA